MKLTKKFFKIIFILPLILISCDSNLEDVNVNPNGVEPGTVDPNLLMSTVMSGVASSTTHRGYASGDISTGAAVQYIQSDTRSTTIGQHYNWNGQGSGLWETYYTLLRNNKVANDRANELGLEFHQGVTLVLKSMLFGTLTDFYGDIPYTDALKSIDEGVNLPMYDSQEVVYKGVIADLEAASVLFAGGDVTGVTPSQDLFYGGDASKWERLANSLALRYYMRLANVLPDFAGPGVTKTVAKPLISTTDDENVLAFLEFVGQDWPNNGFSNPSSFHRIKPCATMVDKMRDLDDPRMAVWFNTVDIPIRVVPAAQVPGGVDDVIENDVRYINEDILAANMWKIYDPLTYSDDIDAGYTLIDVNDPYVGLPANTENSAQYTYNLNSSATQGSDNPHVSRMNEDFREQAGDKLLARLFSAAEVHFLRAEAAQRTWDTNAQGHYEMGVQASLDTWGIGGSYADYIDNPGVAFDGGLGLTQIMEQKWIANMFNGDQSYLDWRRTGLPNLDSGPAATAGVIPVRFGYPDSEININSENVKVGINSLEITNITPSANDSSYDKPWVIQGTGKPW